MSNGEITAWQAGVDWGRAGLSRTAYLESSNATLTALLDLNVAEARQEMGSETFGHWFLLGLADHGQTH